MLVGAGLDRIIETVDERDEDKDGGSRILGG